MRASRVCVVVLSAALLLLAGSACSTKPPEAPSQKASAGTNFGNEILLERYTTTQAGGHAQVTLHWKAVQKPSAAYTVFVHAIDDSGGIKFQFDHPLKGPTGQTTDSWEPGQTAEDTFLALPPSGHAPGKCVLRIGLYVQPPPKFLQIISTDLARPADGWKTHSVLLPDADCR